MSAPVPTSGPPTPADLAATEHFDFDAPAVAAFARESADGAEDEVARASELFAAVRDGIRYSPYAVDASPASFRASAVLEQGVSWCVPKAVLLVAAARASAIPARVGFANVRNHLSTEKLRATMGSDLFVFHGYASLWVDGAWRKTSPAFNAELCARFGTEPLEFDGRTDALLHAFDGEGRRHMEYVHDHGTWTGVPLTEMWQAFDAEYGPDAFAEARRAG